MQIAVERAKPGHREWVRKLAKSVTAGAPVITSRKQASTDPETQAKLDALKAKRPEPQSKLPQTSMVRGSKR
jgi:hypothetical protein